MSVTAKSVNCGTAATLIHTSTSNGCTVFVYHPQAGVPVTFGPSTVTATAGWIASGSTVSSFVFPLPPGDSLFGITASGTQPVGVTISEY